MIKVVKSAQFWVISTYSGFITQSRLPFRRPVEEVSPVESAVVERGHGLVVDVDEPQGDPGGVQDDHDEGRRLRREVGLALGGVRHAEEVAADGAVELAPVGVQHHRPEQRNKRTPFEN